MRGEIDTVLVVGVEMLVVVALGPPHPFAEFTTKVVDRAMIVAALSAVMHKANIFHLGHFAEFVRQNSSHRLPPPGCVDAAVQLVFLMTRSLISIDSGGPDPFRIYGRDSRGTSAIFET